MIEGKILGDIELPEGFRWQDSINTSVGRVGENIFYCTYTSRDTNNYEIVTGIKVKIKVCEKIRIESTEYEITEDEGITYIENIEAGMTIEELIKNVRTNGEISVYDKNMNLVDTDKEIIKTGMIIRIENELEKMESVVVVTGDINGDGKIKASDLSILKKSIVGNNTLEGPYFKAADFNLDKQIKASDLSKLKRLIIGN